jgi:hypothetical protein
MFIIRERLYAHPVEPLATEDGNFGRKLVKKTVEGYRKGK